MFLYLHVFKCKKKRLTHKNVEVLTAAPVNSHENYLKIKRMFKKNTIK